MNARHAIALIVGLLTSLPAAAGDEGVAVTVYNGGFGVVREVRALTVPESGEVRFTDVAARIDPTTVHFRSLADPDAQLLEQNYQYDLVSADKLLQKYLDRSIDVVTEGRPYSGTLLSFSGEQLVLREDDGPITMIQRGENVRDIRFGELPEGLLTRPTLLWLVETAHPGEQTCEVTYQTGGMRWHAEYVLVLDADDRRADLSGWVSAENRSGKTYRDAKLKFIAGEVHRAPEPQPRAARGRVMMEMAAAPEMEEKAFFEYHMYTLPRPSTLGDNEVKQLEMFTPVRGMDVRKRYLYNPLADVRWSRGGRQTDPAYGTTGVKDVNVFIEFTNSEENQLGIPLPAGTVRLYKQDPDDEAVEFIGEDRIEHTPRNEELSLLVGKAFDVVGERTQTAFRIEQARHWVQERITIELRNHKDEPVTVRVKEPMYRWVNWKITDTSHEYRKLDARTVAWDVEVPADGETTVTYTVEYTW